MIGAEARGAHVMSAADILAHLARDLSDPPFTASITELAELWQVEFLRVECQVPLGLEDHPELSVRVRGAFGRQIRALSPSNTTTGASRPSAWDVLAAPLGRLPDGDEIPKPVVLRAAIVGQKLVIEMRILGVAAAWFDDAATALLTALEVGIDLRAIGGLRVPVRVLDIFEQRLAGVVVPRGVTTAALRFRSPVLVRHKHQLVADPRAVLRSVVRRVTNLARWQTTLLEEDWKTLARAIEEIAIDHRDLIPFRWERFSIRSGNRPIPASGWLGTLRLNGLLGSLAPYLLLGETMNAGAQASLGLGWYDLAIA